MLRSSLLRGTCLALATALCLGAGVATSGAEAEPPEPGREVAATDLQPTLDGRWRTAGPAGSSERWSSAGGSTYSLRFRGVGVRLLGTLDPSHGQATVQVDDGAVTRVDQYAATRKSDVAFYTSPELTPGEHIVVLRVTGTKHRASTGRIVAIRRAVVIPSPAAQQPLPMVSSLVVNDAETGTGLARFHYRGDWSRSSGAAKHEQDDHWSEDAHSSVSFRFRGVGVALHGAVAPNHGLATVSVDGADSAVVGQHSPQRKDDEAFYDSGPLPDGEHVVLVTVLGERHPASSDEAISIDRATVRQIVASAPEGGSDDGDAASLDEVSEDHESSDGTSSDRAAWREGADGSALRNYASTSTNGSHPLWHVEPGSDPVHRADGRIVKTSTDKYHRMSSTERFGGPGTTLRISYRARATDIRNRSGSRIVEGAKIGLKWPVSQSLTGYSKDDPRSVHGPSSQADPRGPGSYAFLTGLTEGGYMELSRNGYGREGYTFFDNRSVGYEPGSWKDIVVEVAWQADRSIRVRYWHHAAAEGAPVYEATDRHSPFWSEPAFLWLRTDDADWEYDHITVACAGRC